MAQAQGHWCDICDSVDRPHIVESTRRNKGRNRSIQPVPVLLSAEQNWNRVNPIRPNFVRPPLLEQAISVVFQPIAGFRIVDFGLFWSELATEFPEVASEPAIEAPIETFDSLRQAEMSFQLIPVQPMPRAMFRNPQNGELIQLQRDRFGFNWAKVGDNEYPHSEKLMGRFKKLLKRFESYVDREKLGSLTFQQCELTNLNVIPVSDFGSSLSDLTNALRVDPADWDVDCLIPEAFQRVRQHKIIGENGEPLGRLHSAITPVISKLDNSPAVRFEITARSGPFIESSEAADKFFETARSAINGAFLASTTDEIKRKWGYLYD